MLSAASLFQNAVSGFGLLVVNGGGDNGGGWRRRRRYEEGGGVCRTSGAWEYFVGGFPSAYALG